MEITKAELYEEIESLHIRWRDKFKDLLLQYKQACINKNKSEINYLEQDLVNMYFQALHNNPFKELDRL